MSTHPEFPMTVDTMSNATVVEVETMLRLAAPEPSKAGRWHAWWRATVTTTSRPRCRADLPGAEQPVRTDRVRPPQPSVVGAVPA
jgi:hypothetical protein